MNYIRNMKISSKIRLIIILGIASLLLVGYISFSNIMALSKQSEEMYNEQLQSISILGKIKASNRLIDLLTFQIIDEQSTETKNQLIQFQNEELRTNSNLIANFKKTNLLNKEEELLGDYMENWTILDDTRKSIIEGLEDGQAIKDKRELIIANEMIVDQLITNKEKSAEEINQANNEKSKNTIIMTAIIIIFTMIFLLLSGVFISRLITKPLYHIKQLLDSAEKGDFSLLGSYHSKDELGELTMSFNRMQEGLRNILLTVGQASNKVTSTSEELRICAEQNTRASEHITSSIEQLSSGAEQQASTLKQSSKSVEEIVKFTEKISNNAHHASDTAKQTSEFTKGGIETVQKMTGQMNSIHQNVHSLSSAIIDLSNRSSQIGKITSVITSIAEQTNLLALNAAIEAARAGEAGKGFAVVADEVRKLAEESAKSAKQINELIATIQTDTENTLSYMERAMNDVKIGTHVVSEADRTFHNIQQSIVNLELNVTEVADSITQLETSANTIQTSMEDVYKIADNASQGTKNVAATCQEQLASTEEITASANSLASMADELHLLLLQFKFEETNN